MGLFLVWGGLAACWGDCEENDAVVSRACEGRGGLSVVQHSVGLRLYRAGGARGKLLGSVRLCAIIAPVGLDVHCFVIDGLANMLLDR